MGDRAREIIVEAVAREEKLQRIEAEAVELDTESDDSDDVSECDDGEDVVAVRTEHPQLKSTWGDDGEDAVAMMAVRRNRRSKTTTATQPKPTRGRDRGRAKTIGLSAECIEERRNLLTSIARLNAVANFDRKGRDAFDAEVLESAIATLRVCEADEAASPKAAEERSVAASLAVDVIKSFDAMREYLSEVKTVITRVDPHLRNNPGLVARLVGFEEKWEIGALLFNPDVMDEVCSLVVEVRSAARALPAFAEMLQNCDVELFLCLPRLIWLRYLAGAARKRRETDSSSAKTRRGRDRGRAKTMPTGGTFGANFTGCSDGSGLVRAMLQQRFDSAVFSDGLDALTDKFEKARCCIHQALCESEDQELATRFVFLQRAAAGSGDETSDDHYAQSLERGPLRRAAITAVEELMHDLEAYSMELQRHCPQDWNQCAAVLVQQLTEGDKTDRRAQFQV